MLNPYFSLQTYKKYLEKNILSDTMRFQCTVINLLLHFHQNISAFWKILFKYFSGNMRPFFAFLACRAKSRTLVEQWNKYLTKHLSYLGNNKYSFQLKEGSCRAGRLCVWNTFIADVLIPSREHLEKVLH